MCISLTGIYDKRLSMSIKLNLSHHQDGCILSDCIEYVTKSLVLFVRDPTFLYEKQCCSRFFCLHSLHTCVIMTKEYAL